MSPLLTAGIALATALLLPLANPADAAQPLRFDPDPAWRHAANVSELTAVLESWLDAHAAYPRRADVPAIRVIGRYDAAALAGGAARMAQIRRGLYHSEAATIYLVAPWSPKRAEDVSVLLHELVHHRQTARHWYCPGAQEPDAYRLQAAWLAERGLDIRVDRIAVALEAGCTPRDIHPD